MENNLLIAFIADLQNLQNFMWIFKNKLNLNVEIISQKYHYTVAVKSNSFRCLKKYYWKFPQNKIKLWAFKKLLQTTNNPNKIKAFKLATIPYILIFFNFTSFCWGGRRGVKKKINWERKKISCIKNLKQKL